MKITKQTFIIMALLLLCGQHAFSQRKQGTPGRPMQPSYGVKKATVIGTSKIRIRYAFQPKDLCGMLSTHSEENQCQLGKSIITRGWWTI